MALAVEKLKVNYGYDRWKKWYERLLSQSLSDYCRKQEAIMSSKMLVDSLGPTASECQEQSIKNVARKAGVA